MTPHRADVCLHHVEHVMGMAVSFDIRQPAPISGTLTEVLRWLHHVDATFSTYLDDSEITRFGRGEIAIDDLTAEVQDVLLQCIELTDLTGGAFDVFAVPAPNGTQLDPSGFVKGWSIERAAAMLEDGGAINFCINAGGDIAVRGEPAPGDAWQIGIRHPDHVDQLALVLEVRGTMAIATSATYERGAHIMDPRVGSPTTELASATVVGRDLGIADAYATAAFVLGLDAIEWIDPQPGYDAYLITHDGETCWSTDFPHPSQRVAAAASARR
ncbi:MAG: FAD:protein FMN transferase [Ilumatobacteraceae bacterium]